MVIATRSNEFRYSIVDEKALDGLLTGKNVDDGGTSFDGFRSHPLRSGQTGVLWSVPQGDDTRARPHALICRDDDVRRLCGRYAQLHSELSPLSAWCHLLTPRFGEPLDGVVRQPNLEGWEAAWVGLVVAETMLTAERPLSSLRISACLASQSFAIARTSSLWYGLAQDEILKRFDIANEACRTDRSPRRENRSFLLRTALHPIWTVLAACVFPKSHRDEFRSVVSAVMALRDARLAADEFEARAFSHPLLELVPEAEPFSKLPELTPESRLRLFDTIVACLGTESEHATQRKVALAALAGYLATVAAGGAPSLALAESLAGRWPEITAWAYLIGGVGEKVLWTSAFDGLGRLIARELQRAFRLDESPTSDFALDEMTVLADRALKDPLVNLRVKQARLVTVAIFPGVNVSVPIGEPASLSSMKPEAARSQSQDPISLLADAIWPYLRRRVDDCVRDSVTGEIRRSERTKRKGAAQSQLPLADDTKRNR